MESYALQEERETWDAIAAAERSSTERAGYRRLEARYAGACDAFVRKPGVGPAEAETLAYEILDEKQRRELESVARVCPYQLGKNGAAPAYWLQNLGGNINRQRRRLEKLRRQEG